MTGNDSVALIGDIGGTNCRLAVTPARPPPGAQPAISGIRTYLTDDYPAFEDAVAAYLREADAVAVGGAVVAVAGPVSQGVVEMTNHAWRISEQALAAALGGARCRVINDFEALAHALPALTPTDVEWLGGPRALAKRGNMAVMGAGTGFGTAALVRDGAGQAVVVGEGGHSAFAPADEVEIEIWRRLAHDHGGYVQVEHLLSGPGLLNIHRALSDIEGRAPLFQSPDAITHAASAGDGAALAVADLFAKVFGAVAGDVALIYGARGGVFLAGGVSQRLLSARNQAAFRARFEAKGAFSDYLTAIPTQLISHPQPGLLGAACALADLPSPA